MKLICVILIKLRHKEFPLTLRQNVLSYSSKSKGHATFSPASHTLLNKVYKTLSATARAENAIPLEYISNVFGLVYFNEVLRFSVLIALIPGAPTIPSA